MNCKPGDLAIIVKSMAGNEGRVLRVLRFIGEVEHWVGHDRWEVDVVLACATGETTNTCQDSILRAIRDPGDDATDETLEWLPVPGKQVTA
jgi:hypothetical protein